MSRDEWKERGMIALNCVLFAICLKFCWEILKL
jgi:hypothetical protein